MPPESNSSCSWLGCQCSPNEQPERGPEEGGEDMNGKPIAKRNIASTISCTRRFKQGIQTGLGGVFESIHSLLQDASAGCPFSGSTQQSNHLNLDLVVVDLKFRHPLLVLFWEHPTLKWLS